MWITQQFDDFEPLGESIIETMKKQLPKKTGKKVEFRRYKPFPPITTEEEWKEATDHLHFIEDNLEMKVIPIEQIPSKEDHR